MDIHVLLEKGYTVWLDLAFVLIKLLELTSQIFFARNGSEETLHEEV